jgi:hypothetical protein
MDNGACQTHSAQAQAPDFMPGAWCRTGAVPVQVLQQHHDRHRQAAHLLAHHIYARAVTIFMPVKVLHRHRIYKLMQQNLAKFLKHPQKRQNFNRALQRVPV